MDKNADPLVSVLTRRAVRWLAGSRYFERGENYFADGRVHTLAEHRGTITAAVHGTRVYRVRLWIEDGDIEHSCTCPVGVGGSFCKHCVAVALEWLEEGQEGSSPKSSAGPAVAMDDVRRHLGRQDRETLVALLIEQALADHRLYQRLLLMAAKGASEGLDLTTYRRAIDDAVDTAGFVDYGAAFAFAQGIDEVTDSIEELLEEGHATEVVELSEHALAAVEAAMHEVDDSDGWLGGTLERLQEIHHTACTKAEIHPETLARRLFGWELNGDWDIFYGAVETYKKVLGEEGLAVYRQLAEAEWAGVPALAPGGDDRDRYGKRYSITGIMERLAGISGDIEALVAIKKRDLSSPYSFLEIARAYQQVGELDVALKWAERGLEEFPRRVDSRLREFVADEYHRRGRHDEALELMWAQFAERPGLQKYETLKQHADRIGEWPAWRKKAWARLRDQLSIRKREAREGRLWRSADHSELVRILLWEKDSDAAWAEAESGGCSDDLWLELAAERQKDHPEDVIPVYQRQVESTLAHTNRRAYEAAVRLLRKVHEAMARLHMEEEFESYVQALRAKHKRKRNFMAMLSEAKW